VPTLIISPRTTVTRHSRVGAIAVAAACINAALAHSALASPWAGSVASFNPGLTPQADYPNPATTLGSPERFTGEGEFPSNVTLFNPAFGVDELFSIGEGGHLTLELSTPATNDAAHLHGVDLIVFGNAGFLASDYPNMGSPAELFQPESGRIEVSGDGVNFFEIPGWTADNLFPTLGYLDVEGFSGTPGNVPTNFLRPMNPALTLSSFDGLTYDQALALYDGSGGGTPIDIGLVGLATVTYVRISVDDDLNASTNLSAEIDAVATVPEPATALLALAAGVGLVMRKSRLVIQAVSDRE